MGDAHRPRIHWCLFRFVKERLSLLVLSQVSSLVLGVSVSGGVTGTCRYRNTSTSQVFAEIELRSALGNFSNLLQGVKVNRFNHFQFEFQPIVLLVFRVLPL